MASARDGVPLWWAAEGDGTPVVLVPGRGDSTDIFPSRFTEALMTANCRVIRFDPRDTGLSGDGGPDDTIRTMADDVLDILDAADVPAAHFVGLSMGGLLLVDIVGREPGRVLSVTFLSAVSPLPGAGIGVDFFEVMGDDPVRTIVAAMGSPSDADRAWVALEVASSERRARPIDPTPVRSTRRSRFDPNGRPSTDSRRSQFPALRSTGRRIASSRSHTAARLRRESRPATSSCCQAWATSLGPPSGTPSPQR